MSISHKQSMRLGTRLVLAGSVAFAAVAGTIVLRAQEPLVAPLILSLKGVAVPEPPNLGDFVVDRQAAIVLGKALFWDMNAGSDETQACATCHFSAGADIRIKNQINPDLNNQAGSPLSQTFDRTASGGNGGPNYTLRAGDFPFHQLADPADRHSPVLFDSDDVSSSQGVRETTMLYTVPGDEATVNAPTIFQIGVAPYEVHTRKAEPRNAPTTINAAFNYRNFWDGRANNVFNGRNPFGNRDASASIWVTDAAGNVSAARIALTNASAASQAVGPAVSNFEMSAAGRTFTDIGRKLITLRALNKQTVDSTDSVLGPHVFINGSGVQGLGLKETYKQLIQKAFAPKYWNAKQSTFYMQAGTSNTQMEENFSLFWGLSIMIYEGTLVSDDSRFDRYMDGDRTALTLQEIQGMSLFTGKGNCVLCHFGPEFTSAATNLQKEAEHGILVERMLMGDLQAGLYDQGFYNIGVVPTANDLGVGGTDPSGQPLSFARQFVNGLNGLPAPDLFNVNTCGFAILTCIPVNEANPRVAVDGSFKVPTLRNVELTGPYFHTGGYATLESVVDFYNRGGNSRYTATGDTTGFGDNPSNLDAEIIPRLEDEITEIPNRGFSDSQRAALVAFLKSLTDERVRWEKAPFDHPSLKVPNGHPGDEFTTTVNSDGTAKDTLLVIPAIGAAGRAAKGLGAIQPFKPLQ